MSENQSELLRLIDPLTVRMISIDGTVIWLVVKGEEPLKRFEFNTEAEARAAKRGLWAAAANRSAPCGAGRARLRSTRRSGARSGHPSANYRTPNSSTPPA